jgi:small conductance mechanosensitive channel
MTLPFSGQRLIPFFLIAVFLVAPAAMAEEQGTPVAPMEPAQVLLDRIDLAREKVAKLVARQETATGEEARLLARRLDGERMKGFEDIQSLARYVVEQKEQGADVTALEAQVVPMMQGIRAAVDRLAGHRRSMLLELSEKRDAASASERPVIERRMDNELARTDVLYQAYVTHIGNMEALDLDTEAERADLGERLIERAESLAVRIELAGEQKSDIEARLKDLPGDADLISLLRAGKEKLEGSIRSLNIAVDLMDQLDIETAEFRELLIAAQGHLTTDILDTGVVVSLVRNWMTGIRNWITDHGPGWLFKILLLVAILFVFRMLSKVVREVTRKAISSSKLNFTKLLREMIVSSAGSAVMVIGLLIALSQLGISLGPLLAGFGIAGFVLGFALQDSLANFAAGMMILLYRPYDVGDLIEAVGVFGKVNHMNLVSTTILTLDHQTLIVPNGKIWGDVIKNVTAQNLRRVDMTFGISYSDDIPQTEAILKSIVEAHDKVLADPEPMIKLHELGDSSVNFVVRPWVETDDYWDVYWDITREVKMRFDAEGVSIPFPQRDVHLYPEQAAAQPSARE